MWQEVERLQINPFEAARLAQECYRHMQERDEKSENKSSSSSSLSSSSSASSSTSSVSAKDERNLGFMGGY